MASRREQSTKICFVHTQPDEQDFFADGLDNHDLTFVSTLDDVPDDAEILSVFVSERVDSAFLSKRPSVRLIATRSTGADHIDLKACRRRKVAVATVATHGENTVAEHTFALILALSRRLRESEAAVKAGRFTHEELSGFDLRGKTLGVVGAGRIGLHVIRIGIGFGMKVIASDSHPHPFFTEILDFSYVPQDVLLEEAHVITLHVPLNAHTHHMINSRVLSRCKPGALIINTARGGLMDIEAVIKALDSGRLGGVGLDVLEDERVFQGGATSVLGEEIARRVRNTAAGKGDATPDNRRLAKFSQLVAQSHLVKRQNVVITPHVAYNSIEARTRMCEITVENIRNFLKAGKES